MAARETRHDSTWRASDSVAAASSDDPNDIEGWIISQGVTLPKRPRGRPSPATEERYAAQVALFCTAITQINSTLDFRMSSRGWCYILEQYGALTKGDFDLGQKLIVDCRKSGDLPLDICADDNGRAADHLEDIDDLDPSEYASERIRNFQRYAHLAYTPCSFWDDLDFYVEMAVEKVDLKGLFSPICREFQIPLTNIKGWNDLNSRAAMMRRFAEKEAQGKQCVLLYCGDHDPGGLVISQFLRSNMRDLSGAVGWSPDDSIIDRFGLNLDFIEELNLTWIDNLETSSGGRLDDPKHPDHHKSYVQSYLARFGARKVEANALVVRPEAGRELCRKAVLQYIPDKAVEEYNAKLRASREAARFEIAALLRGGLS
jgi:hypothetical protein